MSLFPIPKGVIDKLVKIQRDFLWCGVDGSVHSLLLLGKNWCYPKFLGVLVLETCYIRTLPYILFKWLWRYFGEPSAFWRSFIADKKGYSSYLTFCNITIPSYGEPWKTICNMVLKHPVASLFGPQKIRKSVGCGTHTLFWQEVWLGNAPLKTLFPRLFLLSLNPLATIASLGIWDGFEWRWTLLWRRSLRPLAWYIEEREALHALLKSWSLLWRFSSVDSTQIRLFLCQIRHTWICKVFGFS